MLNSFVPYSVNAMSPKFNQFVDKFYNIKELSPKSDISYSGPPSTSHNAIVSIDFILVYELKVNSTVSIWPGYNLPLTGNISKISFKSLSLLFSFISSSSYSRNDHS